MKQSDHPNVNAPEMEILVDTREQTPFLFQTPFYKKQGVQTTKATLQTGDYSLAAYEDLIAIERKSLPDLIACLGNERDRFERELQRAVALQHFAVIVEASYTDIKNGYYNSLLNPHAACQSIAAFQIRYGIPFLFCDTRPAAEYQCWSLLWQFAQQEKRMLKPSENDILIADAIVNALIKKDTLKQQRLFAMNKLLDTQFDTLNFMPELQNAANN